MLAFIRRLTKYLPTLLLAFIMACAVWISAVTAADPNEQNVYPNPITVNVIGQDPGLVVTNPPANQPISVNITLIAPHSVWQQLDKDTSLISATMDISGLAPGTHNVRIQVSIDPRYRPVQIVSVDPVSVKIALEQLATRTLPLSIATSGTPAVGYALGLPSYSPDYVSVSGPQSLVQQVYKIGAELNANLAQTAIHETLPLQALDINGDPINGLHMTPETVAVNLPVTQLGGYLNVVIKIVTKGQVSDGYRETNVSVSPPTVTVFSADPKVVDTIPGYVDTLPIDLTNARDDIDTQVGLSLPDGVTVVGSQTVTVHVGVSAIESSITLTNMPVQAVNLGPNLAAKVSPDKIDVILSGPLLLLNNLVGNQVHVTVDLTGKGSGEYSITPNVTIDIPAITVVNTLPSSIQVTVTAATPTPVPSPNLTGTVATSLSPTITTTP